jgi:hypothetical protein
MRDDLQGESLGAKESSQPGHIDALQGKRRRIVPIIDIWEHRERTQLRVPTYK